MAKKFQKITLQDLIDLISGRLDITFKEIKTDDWTFRRISYQPKDGIAYFTYEIDYYVHPKEIENIYILSHEYGHCLSFIGGYWHKDSIPLVARKNKEKKKLLIRECWGELCEEIRAWRFGWRFIKNYRQYIFTSNIFIEWVKFWWFALYYISTYIDKHIEMIF